MNMQVLPQVTKKDENNMLINSNCRVIEPVIFQPNLSISCQVTMTTHVQEGPSTLSARSVKSTVSEIAILSYRQC